jgi:hypothetical protein
MKPNSRPRARIDPTARERAGDPATHGGTGIAHEEAGIITGLEEALLRIGNTLAKRAARAWLAGKTAEERRGEDLSELVTYRYPLLRHRREFRRRMEEIEERITERLLPLCERDVRDLPENERLATLAAVADALDSADLSDDVLFRVDLDPIRLAKAIRAEVPDTIYRAALSEPGDQLFTIILDQTCYYLAHLVRELPEFQARAAIETLERLTGIGEQLSDVLERLPVTSLDSANHDNQDERFLANYAQLVSALYDRLEILGITTNYYEPSVTLSVAYLSLTASSRLADVKSPEPSTIHSNKYAADNSRGPVVRVEDALGSRQRVLIRGDAGAGKSTLLQWLATTAVRQRFVGKLSEWNGLVPFLIRLRDFADLRLPDGDEILKHDNAPQWGDVPEGWVHRLGESGRALFLIDGIDELPEHDRPQVRTWLQSLGVRYPECRIVVTSRPSDATERTLANQQFHRVTLEPMTTEDVRIFVERWHNALVDTSGGQSIVLPCPREDIPKHKRALHTHLAARPHLRSLARNPLLCAMICALNLDRRANIPRDRMTLYDAALDMLLERRDAEKGVGTTNEFQLSAVQKRALLRALAWWLNENRRAEMSHEEAIHQLTLKIEMMPGVGESPKNLLRHLLERSGLLRQPVVGRIDFVHRTFQEFLAAKEVVERDSIDMLVHNAHSDLWRETILMACAHASTPQRNRLLTGIMDRAYDAYQMPDDKARRQLKLLAVMCLEVAVEVSTAVIRRVESCIDQLLPPTSAEEVNALATIGSVLMRTLRKDLNYVPADSAILTVRAVALSDQEQALDLLRHYALDPRLAIQEEIVNCARYFDLGEYTARVLADAPLFDRELEVTDISWLPHLKNLKRLRRVHVKIHPDSIDDVGLFVDVPHLRGILAKIREDCDLAPLGGLAELEYLNLSCGGTFSSLHTLGYLTSLEELSLAATRPVDELRFVESLPRLRRLEVANLGAGVGLAVLASLKSLRAIGLRGCRARIDVATLAQLPHLHRLDVRGCAGTLDLSPLAGREIRLVLEREQSMIGLDDLGPGSEVLRH